MDHQAIVWCHGILNQVRKTIWALSIAKDKDATERLKNVQSILGDDTYSKDLGEILVSFKDKYGFWKDASMQSAMIYNLPFISYFYSIIASLKCAYGEAKFSPLYLFAAILFGWIWSDISKETVVILCLLANSIHSIITNILPLGFIQVKSWSRFFGKCLVVLVTLQFSSLALARHVIGLELIQHPGQNFFLFSVMLVYLSLFLLIGVDQRSCLRRRSLKVNFVALVSLTVPVIVAGPISLMIWEDEPRASSWFLLLKILLPVFFFCVSKTTLLSDDSMSGKWSSICTSLVILIILKICPATLSKGHGFLLSDLVSSIALVHIVVDAMQYIVTNYVKR